MEFPYNVFHLRHPLFEPLDESLPEAEIHTRLLEEMGEIPRRFTWLSRIEPASTGHLGYLAVLAATLATNRRLARYGASILYRTLVYPVIDSVPFRATPWCRIKARLASNGPALTKRRNAELAPWGGSLRASRSAAIRGVMPLAKG